MDRDKANRIRRIDYGIRKALKTLEAVIPLFDAKGVYLFAPEMPHEEIPGDIRKLRAAFIRSYGERKTKNYYRALAGFRVLHDLTAEKYRRVD